MLPATLDVNRSYTYADYLRWQIEERIELIKGRIYELSAPNRAHQDLSGYLHISFGNYLKGKECRLYSAPFDVRLPRKSRNDRDIVTVLQPDLCVICDRSKLDVRGCVGAPDLVVEILSPGNNAKELKNKYEVYEEAGVREYWVVSPNEETLLVYTLRDGQYVPSRLLVAGDVFRSEVLEGFALNIEEMFASLA